MGMNWTAPKISSHKVRDGNTPLVMLTAYDAPGAKMVTEAGADIILVGDSLGITPPLSSEQNPMPLSLPTFHGLAITFLLKKPSRMQLN
jgi:3-methyl-2-oxobutanoate hydroxymethyltransferase